MDPHLWEHLITQEFQQSNHAFANNSTVDGRNPAPPNPGMYKTPRKWDKLPTSTGERRISEPSTVSQKTTNNASKMTTNPMVFVFNVVRYDF